MPLSSMTGYARASASHDGLNWQWEIKSVNGKGLDVRCRLAPGFDLIQAPWPAGREESRSGHALLIASLEAGDATAARDAMHHHVMATEHAIHGVLARHGVDLGRGQA